MANFCVSYCLILSIFAAVFLAGLGYIFSIDYRYLPIEDPSGSSTTCYISGLVYVVIVIVLIIVLVATRKKATKKEEGENHPGIQLQEFGDKVPNPSLESGVSSSLLVNS